MSTDDQLRRRIAELDGWTDIHEFPGGPLVGIEPTGLVSRAVPDWTTDINAAVELTEKIELSGCEVLARLQRRHGKLRWFAWLAPPGKPHVIFGRDGASLCEALCRLYIAWQEVRGYSAAIAIVTGE